MCDGKGGEHSAKNKERATYIYVLARDGPFRFRVTPVRAYQGRPEFVSRVNLSQNELVALDQNVLPRQCSCCCSLIWTHFIDVHFGVHTKLRITINDGTKLAAWR